MKSFNSWDNSGMVHLFLILSLLHMAGINNLCGQNFQQVAAYDNIRGFVATDALQNIYSLERGVLSKSSPQQTTISYSNFQRGHIASADVTDPLNILVFFRDFGHVVLLDRNLSEKNILEGPLLRDSDLPSVICYSSRQGFWAYFPGSFRLARFNFRGISQVVSNDLSLWYPQMGEIVSMKESDDKLFLSANGIWVFDLHANFLFHIEHIQTKDFQVKGNNVVYIQDNSLYVYDFFLEKENVFLLPEKTVTSFFVKNKQTIYLQTDVSLKVFQTEDRLF